MQDTSFIYKDGNFKNKDASFTNTGGSFIKMEKSYNFWDCNSFVFGLLF